MLSKGVCCRSICMWERVNPIHLLGVSICGWFQSPRVIKSIFPFSYDTGSWNSVFEQCQAILSLNVSVCSVDLGKSLPSAYMLFIHLCTFWQNTLSVTPLVLCQYVYKRCESGVSLRPILLRGSFIDLVSPLQITSVIISAMDTTQVASKQTSQNKHFYKLEAIK